MAKSSKSAPPRKPIKARGALPTPKTSPVRVQRRWYHRRELQSIGVVIVLIAIVLITRAVLDWREDRAEHKQQVRQVRAFERKLQLLLLPNGDLLQAINRAPGELQAGTLPPEEFIKQTEVWLEKFRALDLALRERKVPPTFKSLVEARAMLVQGSVVYIDAVKQFQAAAAIADPAIRAKVLKEAQSTIIHATSIFGNGQRAIAALRVRLGLDKQDANNPLLQPIQLPLEIAPDAPPPGAEQGGTIPGQPPGQVPIQLPPGGSAP